MDTRLGSFLEVAPDAIAVLGAADDVRAVNQVFADLFGYRRADLIGVPIARLIPALPRRASDHRLAQEPGLAEVGQRKDGASFSVELRARMLGSGRSAKTVLSVRSTGTRVHSRGEGHETALDSELVASMAHELRTPLNAVIGFTELILRGKGGPVAPEQREYLGDILTSGRRLQRMINALLDLARIDAGCPPEAIEPIGLERLVGEVRDVLRGLAATRRVHFEIEAEPSAGQTIREPARLKQILTSYGAQALKLSPAKGAVRLRVAPAGLHLLRLQVDDGTIGSSTHLGRPILIATTGTEKTVGG